MENGRNGSADHSVGSIRDQDSAPKGTDNHSATPTNIDEAAPVISRHSTTISAPLRLVWEIHTDIAGWPRWQEDISEARIDGGLAVGTSFTWKTRGIDAEIASRVFALESMARTLWGGMAAGIMGIHEWRFDGGAGKISVRTSESWSGEPVVQNTAEIQLALDESLTRWLRFLKSRAERLVAQRKMARRRSI